jgi:uncharacterized protein YqfA (UPF0365 family)
MAADVLGALTQPLVVALLVAAGLLLLGSELAVLPGIGVAGVAGVAAPFAWVFFYLVSVGLWITAAFSGVRVGPGTLVGDIAEVDVGRKLGAELQADQAEADKQIAQAKAERDACRREIVLHEVLRPPTADS